MTGVFAMGLKKTSLNLDISQADHCSLITSPGSSLE